MSIDKVASLEASLKEKTRALLDKVTTNQQLREQFDAAAMAVDELCDPVLKHTAASGKPFPHGILTRAAVKRCFEEHAPDIIKSLTVVVSQADYRDKRHAKRTEEINERLEIACMQVGSKT